MTVNNLVVGPDTVRMLALGHPWVLDDSWTRQWPPGVAGDLVRLTDEGGRFLATALRDPGDKIVARVLANCPMNLNREWLRHRLHSAVQHREMLADAGDLTAYRLVNGEGDGMPGLTVDRYGDHLLVQLYCRGWDPYLQKISQVLLEVCRPSGIYAKVRPRNTRELEAVGEAGFFGQLVAGDAAPDRMNVLENGLNFLVTLSRGLNTGLFLDQRMQRRYLMSRVKGKRVLNLFAHTGAFSVVAAASGASRVTSVDVSPLYTEWGKENFGVNRLNPKRHDFLVGDCLAVVSDLARKGSLFDVVIIDPPSFATTSKSRFTTRGGTAELVATTLPLLSSGGVMMTSSNHQKVEWDEYLKELRRGALRAGHGLRVVHLSGQPEDFPFPVTFPEGRYLKCAVCVKV